MNRLLLSWIVLALGAAVSGCDKRQTVPLPKTGASVIKQQARPAVGAPQSAAKGETDEFIAALAIDLCAIKASIGDLRSKAAVARGKARTALQQQITALNEQLNATQQKLAQRNAAAVHRCKDLQHGMRAAIGDVTQPVQEARKGSV